MWEKIAVFLILFKNLNLSIWASKLQNNLSGNNIYWLRTSERVLRYSLLLCDYRSLNPMFEGGLQHDCHEVMRCLLAYVENATKEVNKHRKRMKLLPGTINLNPPGEWAVRCHGNGWCGMWGVLSTKQGCHGNGKYGRLFFQTRNLLWIQGHFWSFNN